MSSIVKLPVRIPAGYAVSEWDSHLLTIGQRAVCRFCGDIHEGTSTYGIAHWNRCLGVVVWARARAFGLDDANAVQMALFVLRDAGETNEATREVPWALRDFASAEAERIGDAS